MCNGDVSRVAISLGRYVFAESNEHLTRSRPDQNPGKTAHRPSRCLWVSGKTTHRVISLLESVRT